MKLQYIVFSCLFLLTGCGSRYFEWGKDVFHQSQKQFTYTAVRNSYVQSIRIYDQFTTLALFDALWLSDEVRALYSKEHTALYGSSNERYENFLEMQLAKNKEEIAFYVLASIPHSHDVLLTDAHTPWTLFLSVNGRDYEPQLLKVVDLPHTYQVIMGKRYSYFKTVYYVTFSAKLPDGSSIITDATKSLSLVFHTTGRENESVQWTIASGRALSVHTDNPDVLAYDL